MENSTNLSPSKGLRQGHGAIPLGGSADLEVVKAE
jgi:hypothetical protein